MLVAAIVLRVEVQNVDPLIWRVVRVPVDLRLSELHGVLQVVMGWADTHPHAFEIPRVNCRNDEDLTIAEALEHGRHAIIYTYDAGRGWRLRITRAAGSWRSVSKFPIVCLDGYLAGPRDDSGGPVAHNAILAATLGRGPRLTPAMRDQLGPQFDPEEFDRHAINRALAHLRA